MRKIDELYLHVGNSGATFSVRDSGFGPEIVVRTSAFGNLNHEFCVKTDRKSLRTLGKMLTKASTAKFSKEYVHKARLLEERTGNCQNVALPKTPLKGTD